MDKRNNKTSKDEKIKKLKSNTSKSSGLINKNNSKALNSYMAMDNKLALQAMKPYMTMDKILKQSTAMGHLMSQNRKLYPISARMFPQVRNNFGLDTWRKNLNSIKKSSLQPARGAVQLAYFKRTGATVDSFRDLIKSFKSGTSLANNYSQIVAATNMFQKLAEKTFGRHNENVKVAKILMKHGWTTSEFFYNEILKNNYHKSEDSIIEYIETFYTENNFQRFYRIYDLVIERFQELGMCEGYRLQLVKIKKLIKQDFNNYDLFINNLFSIAEYVCDFQFNLLSNNDYIKKETIKNARKEYADKNGQLTAIDLMSLFSVLKDWWCKANFKVGLKKTLFGRNTVEHGRYDPRRYKKTDFIKVVVFIFNAIMSPSLNKEKNKSRS